MKIKYYTLLTIIFLSTFCSCSDNLNTNPTDQISGNVIFKDVEGGMVAMNGVYRMTTLHTPSDICQPCWYPGLWVMT